MRTDIVIDLETLATNNTPVILQIAAVAFDINTGNILRKYNTHINLDSCLKVGLDIQSITLNWWLKQDSELIQDVFKGNTPIEKALKDFNKWLNAVTVSNKSTRDQVYLWGNGILADNTWLKSAYEKCDMNYPIKYTNDRDIRTLVEAASHHTNLSPSDIHSKLNFIGDKHNALHDAIYASKIISSCWSLMSS